MKVRFSALVVGVFAVIFFGRSWVSPLVSRVYEETDSFFMVLFAELLCFLLLGAVIVLFIGRWRGLHGFRLALTATIGAGATLAVVGVAGAALVSVEVPVFFLSDVLDVVLMALLAAAIVGTNWFVVSAFGGAVRETHLTSAST